MGEWCNERAFVASKCAQFFFLSFLNIRIQAYYSANGITGMSSDDIWLSKMKYLEIEKYQYAYTPFNSSLELVQQFGFEFSMQNV